MNLERLCPEHQAFIKRQTKSSEGKRRPGKAKIIKYNCEFDSKLEVEFADQLEAFRLAGILELWRHHPMRLSLAVGCTYTPDFGVRLQGRWILFETKGHWKQKNARDSHTRLVIAQSCFPWWDWCAVLKIKGMFEYEVIGPGAPPKSNLFPWGPIASSQRPRNTAPPHPATEPEPHQSLGKMQRWPPSMAGEEEEES